MSVLVALEGDLEAWNATSGVLVETARQIALAIDSGPSDRELGVLSRELRQLVQAIRAEHPSKAPSEVDRFLASIQADDFR